MNASPAQLIATLQQAAQNTPYVVSPTQYGFRVSHDLGDERWYGTLSASGLREAANLVCRLDEQTSTWVQDESRRSVSWQAGPNGGLMPQLGVEIAVQKGLTYSKSLTVETGPGGSVQQQTYSSEDMKRWLAQTAAPLGWTKSRKLGANAMIGAIVAGLTILGLIVVGILALTGALG